MHMGKEVMILTGAGQIGMAIARRMRIEEIPLKANHTLIIFLFRFPLFL